MTICKTSLTLLQVFTVLKIIFINSWYYVCLSLEDKSNTVFECIPLKIYAPMLQLFSASKFLSFAAVSSTQLCEYSMSTFLLSGGTQKANTVTRFLWIELICRILNCSSVSKFWIRKFPKDNWVVVFLDSNSIQLFNKRSLLPFLQCLLEN